MKSICNYNRNLFIDTLKAELKRRNLKPQDLVKHGIAEQPRISDCLNKQKKANFTLDQIVMLSNYLDISIDTLINPNRVSNRETTLYDIFSLLLSLDSIEPLTIHEDGSITFADAPIIDFLNEWRSIKELRDDDGFIYQSWKEKRLEIASRQQKKYNYLTDAEFSIEFAKQIINDYSHKYTRKLLRYNADSIRTLENNMDSIASIFDTQKLELLYSALDYIKSNYG